MAFKILGPVERARTFATGRRIRELNRLRKVYGGHRWRKRKGFARIQLPDGSEYEAELHWYEAAGVGRGEMKIKRLIRPL